MKVTGEFRGRRVAVIGVGRAGSSAARALSAAGAEVTLYDPKPLEELRDEARELLEEGFHLVTGEANYAGIEGAEVVVPSPGVRADAPVLCDARERGAEVLGEIEVAYRLSEAPIVAITGTNGKSTTTAMCGEILKRAFPRAWVGGNLAPGEPINALAMKAAPEDVIVAEVSSFQLEQISTFRPKVAILTNLSPDHFDRHKDLAEYGAAKARIFENLTPDDFAVINAATARMPEINLSETLRIRPSLFSLERPDIVDENASAAWVEDGWLVARQQGRTERLAPVSCIPVPGRHNVENALAAGLAAWLLGANPDAIRQGLEAFRPVAHRMEPVEVIQGVTYINNSMCTNPAALVASLLSYSKPTILISGGKNKNLDFSQAGPTISQHAKAVILIGAAADEIAAAIGNGGATVIKADTLDEAVEQAHALARPGDVVMLAPGCASFGMFNDFMDRGERFVQTVRNLAKSVR
ncbi:MAG: UDP-N-acetylmuramoyl-L-alanine--D-glutamate ligase, partial [Armatimonadetes bacterium]|nr:UDP-N-acetylmuramoyl-L-alanine--D-glutamate ligase [Armatimonadota bacterium]